MTRPDTLIGRREELARVAEALAALERGRPGGLAVVGEAGIGKTRLLDEALARADDRRVTILRGRAADFEQLVPFGLLIDTLDDALEALDPLHLERLGEDRVAELAAVFPALRRPGPSPVTTQAERYRWHYAVRALLEEIARERPLVLALDDVHWADEASIELLAHLLRRPFDDPIMLMLAYRGRGAPPLLVQSVESAAREHRLELIELGPLTIEQADELLGAAIDPPVRELLFRDSGGNPFYLEQLMRAPVVEATRPSLLGETLEGETGWAVPSSVQASISHELAHLTHVARALLRAAAVAGEPFEPDVAAEVGGLEERDALEALDELVAVDLVRATSAPRRFVFRHPIVCRAVYEATGVGWRLAAHERVANVLAARGEPTVVRAHHVERSARTGNEEAIELLSEAGATAATRAPGMAARWFRAALRLLPPDPARDERRLELLIALAAALASSGRLSESRAALSEALDGMPPDANERRTRVVTLLAQAESFLGRPGEAHALLADALVITGRDRVRERVSLLLEMAIDRLRAGNRDEAATWGAEALAAACDARDRTAECAAAALLGLIEHGRGAMSSARTYVGDAVRLASGLANRDLASRLPALFYLANAEFGLGDHHPAIAHAERGLAISRATGQAFVIVPLMFALTRSKLALGRLREAAADAETMLDSSRLLGVEQYVGWSWSLCASAAIQRGELGTAREAAEQAVRSAEAAPEGLFSWFGPCVLGEVRIASGEPGRGRDDILRHGGGPELSTIEGGYRARWYELLVEAELALERLDAAEGWVRRAEDAVASADVPERRANARRGRAMLMLARERFADAAGAATEAADLFAAGEMRVEAARARLLAGRAAVGIGDRDRAVEIIDDAHRTLEECGARRARDEAARELRRLDRRVPRRTDGGRRDGIAALSRREHEVAELVAQGRTNKDVAAALFVSERTVENHLSHIFQKLDISSRVELTREIARLADSDSARP